MIASSLGDKETYEYFKGTEVHCVLCPRNPVDGNAFMFTHHQKIVVVDSELPNGSSNLKRIVSFVGGIDLCDGRYDTQSHSLFRILSTIHYDDFHQPNFKDASLHKGGPREPWHEIHCRLEDLLLDVQDTTKFIPCSHNIFPDDDHETWNVQVFRSIDNEVASSFPDSPEETAAAGLLNGKDGVIDRSIQDAYIHAIRRAK